MKDSDKRVEREFLTEICKGLENLRLGNRADIRQSQTEAFMGSNKVLSDLNKYLFYVTTFLIPLIFSVVGIESLKSELRPEDFVLIKVSLIFLLLSLIAGFCHMISDIIFFRKWQKNTERRLKLWSSTSFWPTAPVGNKMVNYVNEYDSIKSRVDDIASEMESQSTHLFVFVQGLFWVCGIALIMIIGFVLFT